ncbi:MAG: hypothetical protein M1828_002395 [Chrysothrix sp. TS-e1954]|nr:MAG: hypothetical protein M1828_002395 [Chrysothrix sp. TS-e1954]
MNRRQLPGYYFDEEKGKYFRILPNHNAPTGSPYTKDKVALAQRAAKRQKIEQHRRTEDKDQCVQRSRILSSPLLSEVGLYRELDRSKYARLYEARRKTFVAGLDATVHEVSPNTEISCFTWDTATSSALTSLASDTTACRLPRRHEEFPTVTYHSLMRGFSPQEVSSMTLSPSRVLASTCIGSVTRSGVVLMKMTDADMLLPKSPAEFDLSVVYHFEPETTTWSSAANPFTSPEDTVIAVGTSKEVLLYTDADGRWDDQQRLPGKSDALDLSWLTPQTLATGYRNGDLRLWDLRSQGSAIRLRKTGAVCNIRRTADQGVAIHGMNSIALYDLRMASKRAPRPVTTIDFDNKDGRPRGFDVSTELGVVASADDENFIRLYSLRDGRELGRKNAEATWRQAQLKAGCDEKDLCRPEFGIRCLQFAKVGVDEDVLFGSYAGSVVEWAW